MHEKNIYRQLENSSFYQKNLNIKKNIWKAVTVCLLISIMIVAVKGIS